MSEKQEQVLEDEAYREVYRGWLGKGLSPQDALTKTLEFFLAMETRQ